jgi:multidrug efflux pump subunit AcrA (membrane-fusion protein)
MIELRKRSFYLIAGTAALILILLLVYAYLWQSRKKVVVAAVFRGGVREMVKISGSVDSEFSEKVVSNVEGIISRLKLKEGDRVKVNQKLCEVRNPSLREKIRQQEAELFLVRKELAVTKNESALARYNLLKANIADLRAAIEPVSHINGNIINLNVKEGEKIVPGTIMFVIADLARPILKARLSETDVSRVKLGQPVIIKADFLGNQVMPGNVMKISSFVSHDFGAYIDTWIKMLNSQNIPMKFGAYAEAQVLIGEKRNTLLVPREAIFGTSENWVWMIEDGRAVKRTVKLGMIGEKDAEIVSGLKLGDQVIIQYSEEIEDGDRVRY